MSTAHLLAALLCLQGAGCTAGEPDSVSEPGAEETEDWEWVAIAGFANPGVWSEGEKAADALGAALGRAGIRWGGGGSAYWTINVDSRDLTRAREIVKEAVAQHDLEVWIHE